MSDLLSIFFGWAANILLLSALLNLIYFGLKRLNLKATSRFSFLKSSFLTLPILPLVAEMITRFDFSFRRSASLPDAHPSFITSLESAYVLAPKQLPIAEWMGWIALTAFAVYLVFLSRGIFRLVHSWCSLRRLKKESIRVTSANGHQVLVHDQDVPPAAAGFWPGDIFIPSQLLSEVSEEELLLILDHETIHLKRRDPLFQVLHLGVRELLGFSPFAHWLSKAFEEEMELSVDELILESHQTQRKTYAALLLRLCTLENSAPAMMCNSFFKSGPFIKRRIENMKDNNKKRMSKKMIFATLTGFLAVGAWLVPTLGLAEKSKVQSPLSSAASSDLKKYCLADKCPERFLEKWGEAEKGNPSAQNEIGEMFHFAKGIKKDYAEAMKWYLRASEKQHAVAANHLGRLYLNGEGVEKDATEACKWYEKSGEWGHAWGMMNIASCYKYGHSGFTKDQAKSDEWYQRAEKAQPGIYEQYLKSLDEYNKSKEKSL